MVVNMQVRAEIARWRDLSLGQPTFKASREQERPRTGLIRSLSHQTISEQVLGSGAMTSIGSARIRHSHNDHSAGKKLEKARSGAECGRATNSCSPSDRSQKARGTELTGRSTVLECTNGDAWASPTCAVSATSGNLQMMTSDMNGSSRVASGAGSGQDAIELQAASRAVYPCSKKIGAVRSRMEKKRDGKGRWLRMTSDFW